MYMRTLVLKYLSLRPAIENTQCDSEPVGRGSESYWLDQDNDYAPAPIKNCNYRV